MGSATTSGGASLSLATIARRCASTFARRAATARPLRSTRARASSSHLPPGAIASDRGLGLESAFQGTRAERARARRHRSHHARSSAQSAAGDVIASGATATAAAQ